MLAGSVGSGSGCAQSGLLEGFCEAWDVPEPPRRPGWGGRRPWGCPSPCHMGAISANCGQVVSPIWSPPAHLTAASSSFSNRILASRCSLGTAPPWQQAWARRELAEVPRLSSPGFIAVLVILKILFSVLLLLFSKVPASAVK